MVFFFISISVWLLLLLNQTFYAGIWLSCIKRYDRSENERWFYTKSVWRRWKVENSYSFFNELKKIIEKSQKYNTFLEIVIYTICIFIILLWVSKNWIKVTTEFTSNLNETLIVLFYTKCVRFKNIGLFHSTPCPISYIFWFFHRLSVV